MISAIKHVQKLLEALPKVSPSARYVTIKGMGKAIDRAIVVAVRLQEQGKTVSFHTTTVTVIDEYEKKSDSENPPELKARNVSGIEIRIYSK